MIDQNLILILVIAFFLLGCSFSCNGMKENFTARDINELTDELVPKMEDKCGYICEGQPNNVCYFDCAICAFEYPNTVYNQDDTNFFNNFFNTRAGKCFNCKTNINYENLSVKQKNKKKERCMK